MSSQITCVRRIQFCAGHRVFGHESKCAHLHGHNYVAFIHARTIHARTIRGLTDLDSLGRVVDFGVLKEKVGGWIDRLWDHKCILFQQDKETIQALMKLEGNTIEHLYLMPSNPTAENMAKHIVTYISPLCLKGETVEVFKCVLWETENCYAEYVLD